MRIGVLVLAFVSACWPPSPAAAQIPIPPGWQAERAVVLVRDGVHAPLQTELDSMSPRRGRSGRSSPAS